MLLRNSKRTNNKMNIQGNLYVHTPSNDWFIVMYHLPTRIAVLHWHSGGCFTKVLKDDKLHRFLVNIPTMQLKNTGHYSKYADCYSYWNTYELDTFQKQYFKIIIPKQ